MIKALIDWHRPEQLHISAFLRWNLENGRELSLSLLRGVDWTASTAILITLRNVAFSLLLVEAARAGLYFLNHPRYSRKCLVSTLQTSISPKLSSKPQAAFWTVQWLVFAYWTMRSSASDWSRSAAQQVLASKCIMSLFEILIYKNFYGWFVKSAISMKKRTWFKSYISKNYTLGGFFLPNIKIFGGTVNECCGFVTV